MPRTVTFDRLDLQGANVWVDLTTGDIRLEVNYAVGPSAAGLSINQRRQAQDLLLPEERTAILNMTGRLKGVLEQEELA